MYTCIFTFDNSNKEGEKSVNPRNMSVRPSDIAKLTSEGRATCQQALSDALHYPNIQDDVLPLEYTRGVDSNDVWEAQQEAQEKVRKAVRDIQAAKNNQQTSE